MGEILNPSSALTQRRPHPILTGAGRPAYNPFGFVSHVCSTAVSYFKHQTPHFELLLIHMSPPNTRRVARIVPKKWIARPSEISVSPCPDANKKNLNAGLFLVLDCCTNRIIIGLSERVGLPPNFDHPLKTTKTVRGPSFGASTDMDAQEHNRIELSQGSVSYIQPSCANVNSTKTDGCGGRCRMGDQYA